MALSGTSSQLPVRNTSVPQSTLTPTYTGLPPQPYSASYMNPPSNTVHYTPLPSSGQAAASNNNMPMYDPLTRQTVYPARMATAPNTGLHSYMPNISTGNPFAAQNHQSQQLQQQLQQCQTQLQQQVVQMQQDFQRQMMEQMQQMRNLLQPMQQAVQPALPENNGNQPEADPPPQQPLQQPLQPPPPAQEAPPPQVQPPYSPSHTTRRRRTRRRRTRRRRTWRRRRRRRSTTTRGTSYTTLWTTPLGCLCTLLDCPINNRKRRLEMKK